MKVIYWICPKCLITERTSDLCAGMSHRHNGMLFMCIACATEQEAIEVKKRWNIG